MAISTLTIHTDGGSRGNPGPAAVGIVVLDDQQQVVHEQLRFLGQGTNNEAEYQAVMDALEWLVLFVAKTPSLSTVTFKLDSKLVVEQLNRNWKIKEPRMASLAAQCWQRLQQLGLTVHFRHIPREENSAADALVNRALDAALASPLQ